MALFTGVRRMASKCLSPLARRAAQAYIAGEQLTDAMVVADRLEERGLGVTLGYWDGPDDSPRQVADQYLAAIRSLVGREHDYVSIKVPSLGFSHELMAEVAEQAAKRRVRLHFDALSPDTADRSRALFEEALQFGGDLSYTLPGRWARSIDDAAWAIELQIPVRVVKGQWADPEDPDRDLRFGFLSVIDALAGRARHVAVASHDTSLVGHSVKCLRAAKTSCEVELLYGLPMRESLLQADWLALAAHIYVPYGKAYLPYAMSRVRSNPRMLWWLVRDLFSSRPAVRKAATQARELIPQ